MDRWLNSGRYKRHNSSGYLLGQSSFSYEFWDPYKNNLDTGTAYHMHDHCHHAKSYNKETCMIRDIQYQYIFNG